MNFTQFHPQKRSKVLFSQKKFVKKKFFKNSIRLDKAISPIHYIFKWKLFCDLTGLLNFNILAGEGSPSEQKQYRVFEPVYRKNFKFSLSKSFNQKYKLFGFLQIFIISIGFLCAKNEFRGLFRRLTALKIDFY